MYLLLRSKVSVKVELATDERPLRSAALVPSCYAKRPSTEERTGEGRGGQNRARCHHLNVSSSGSAVAKPVRIAW
jgi:hypothetical protein